MFKWARTVYHGTACDLPGVTIKYDSFIPALWRAVSTGHVHFEKAEMVSRWLRFGVEAGIDRSKLKGKRVFKNYPSATGEFRSRVREATQERVSSGRTLNLGRYDSRLRDSLYGIFDTFSIFPLGAQGKPLEPNKARPVDDHTRTGTNAATDMSHLGHSLDTYDRIAERLAPGHGMYVSDVEAAFAMLPWAPWIWPFMLHRFFDSDTTDALSLFCHINGDFGTRGFPGVFKIFLVDVVTQMAKAAQVLTRPLEIYVDDLSDITCGKWMVEMPAFQDWAEQVCGMSFKRLKDRVWAQVQLMLGFWWDSFAQTRTLEEKKLHKYMDMLADFASSTSLSLHDRQVIAGRMLRATMTMPPGARCLMSNMFTLMSGLSLPWHRRRTTRAERQDYHFLHQLLKMNTGRGYYSYERFPQGPTCLSDASRAPGKYTGGGWFTSDGWFDYFRYGSAAARKPIDFLEGDTVIHAIERQGERWRKKSIPFGIDNQAFQKSAVKGSSRAARLGLLLRRLFVLQIRYDVLLLFFWLSTHANYLADHLSRGRLDAFLAAVGFGALEMGAVPRALPGAGRVRTLDLSSPLDSSDMAIIAAGAEGPPSDMAYYSACVSAAVVLQAAIRKWLALRKHTRLRRARPTRRRRATRADGIWRRTPLIMMIAGAGAVRQDHMSIQQASVSYPPASLYEGLPEHMMARVDEIIFNRLSPSSQKTVNSAYTHWKEVADKYGWTYMIPTGDQCRGGKMVCFVLHMLEDTSLVADSIAGYVWGLRWYMMQRRQADPLMGVRMWHEFMTGIRVLAHVPHEPRRALPLAKICMMIASIDLTSYRWVQFGFFLVLIYFTFSRSQYPCPKSWTGLEAFDPMVHWQVRDILIKLVRGVWVLAIRNKANKTDRRIERPEARGDGTETGQAALGGADWSYIGAIPGSDMDPFLWYRRLMGFYDGPRDGAEPFFLAKDRVRPYTYRCAMTDLREKLTEVSPDDVEYGIHGIRVQAYNDAKEAAGEDVAVAHGGWTPGGAHTRYDRFDLRRDIFPLSARMVGAWPTQTPQTQNTQASPPARPVVRYPGQRRGLTAPVPGTATVTVDGQPAAEAEDDTDDSSVSAHASYVESDDEEACGAPEADVAGRRETALGIRSAPHVVLARRLLGEHGPSTPPPPARPPSPVGVAARPGALRSAGRANRRERPTRGPA
jgi:hypothetical protein